MSISTGISATEMLVELSFQEFRETKMLAVGRSLARARIKDCAIETLKSSHPGDPGPTSCAAKEPSPSIGFITSQWFSACVSQKGVEEVRQGKLERTKLQLHATVWVLEMTNCGSIGAPFFLDSHVYPLLQSLIPRFKSYWAQAT